MELYQLRTFIMVAEEGHLTRAARRLHTSQPAISAQLRALEDELGVALFHRTPKGMVLTTDGQKLKEQADKVLTVAGELVSKAVRMRETLAGELRLGINTGADSVRVPELFGLMKARYPRLDMHLLQCMTGEVLNKLEDGLLDAGFMYGETSAEKIHAVELKELELVIAGPLAWGERLRQSGPADLGGFPWIMTPADCPFHNVATQLFKTYGLVPDQVVLVDQETIIRSMVKAGAGISLLLARDVRQDDAAADMAIWDKEPLQLSLSIACLKRRKEEPMLQALFSLLTDLWTD